MQVAIYPYVDLLFNILFADILALCTRLRPAVLVDYGGIMPKLQENLSSLLFLAKKVASCAYMSDNA